MRYSTNLLNKYDEAIQFALEHRNTYGFCKSVYARYRAHCYITENQINALLELKKKHVRAR